MSPQIEADMAVVKQRILEYRSRVFSSTMWAIRDFAQSLESQIASQLPDGSWPDIDYGDTTHLGGEWAPWRHLMRLERMACSANGSAERIDRVLRGLDFWFERKPACLTNFWHMAMGRNLNMKTLVLVVEPYLSETQKTQALHELFHGIKDQDGDGIYEYYYPSVGVPATGQNAFWLAEIHFHAALFKGAADEAAAAAAALRGLIVYSEDEGVNIDGSFLQHGRQLSTGLYGRNFSQDAVRIAWWFRGLPSFEISAAEREVLRVYFLEGLQWMTRRGMLDPLVCSRQISRAGWPPVKAADREAILLMKEVDPEKAADYQAFHDHTLGSLDASLVGNKHFWRIDYTVHRRPAFSFHIKTSSDRTAIQETGNLENSQNSYESQGATLLLLSGEEYADIFACWRYDRVPGVTCPEKNPAPKTSDWEVRGTQSFVGGVSDGNYGVAMKDLNWDGVNGKKSWFCFDDDIVCLGAGIEYSGDLPVKTTVEQCIRTTDVYVDDTGVNRKSPRWVYHGNTGYVLSGEVDLEVRSETGVEGDWGSINGASHRPGDRVSKDIFALVISHGVNPTAGSYAYTILPAKDRAFVEKYATTPQSRILRNTREIQAVRNEQSKVTGIVFWEPGSVEGVSADTSCAVLVTETHVSVSRFEAAVVTITLERAGATRKLQFRLPGGEEAGKTVTQQL